MSIYHKLSLSVLLTLGAIPMQVNAVPLVDGNSTNIDQVVNNAGAWTTLRTVSFFNPSNKPRRCIATGSSDGRNPFKTGLNEYRFTLSLDNPNPPVDTGFERTLNFRNTPLGGNVFNQVQDSRIKEITSTGGVFRTGPGFHAIRWQARKIGNAANMTVEDSSLSVVCTDEQFVVFDGPIKRF